MTIYSHPWLLRFRFLLVSRLRSSLDLLHLCFLLLPCRGGKRGVAKNRDFRCLYQELRQLQIQFCLPEANCLDRDDDGGDDDADD